MKHSADGFTIIEVILFLGISSLLLVGAFVGMNAAINNTQFNDTTDTTLSYFQKQYLEVATGVNIRGGGLACNSGQLVVDASSTENPGRSNCVILGRLLVLDKNTTAGTVESRYLSSRIVNIEGVSDLGAFSGSSNYQPRISNAPPLEAEFELPWSGIIKNAVKVSGGTADTVGSIAIIRSPVSERMMIYAFASTTPAASEFANQNNLIAFNRSLEVCLQSDNGLFAKKAMLRADPGQGQDLFTVDRSGAGTARCNP